MLRRPFVRLVFRQLRDGPGVAKSCLDVSLALLAMFVTSPLLLALAVWCRLATGRVTHSRQVIGRHGAPFWLHSFSLPDSWLGTAAARARLDRLIAPWHIIRRQMSAHNQL